VVYLECMRYSFQSKVLLVYANGILILPSCVLWSGSFAPSIDRIMAVGVVNAMGGGLAGMHNVWRSFLCVFLLLMGSFSCDF